MPDDADFSETSVIAFPEGIPGFENCRRFVLVQPEGLAPILLLQNLEDKQVSLPVIPVELIDREYRLQVGAGDRELLGLSVDPVVGENVLCLTVLHLPGASPAACNLFAPIVVNPANRRGKQILQLDSDYPSSFSLTTK